MKKVFCVLVCFAMLFALTPNAAFAEEPSAPTVDGGQTGACAAGQTTEYRINGLSVRRDDGTLLREIPKNAFLAAISVTKLTDAGNAVVSLASYTAGGQFRGLTCVGIEDLPVGETTEVTLSVENGKNDIAALKAFVIPSFSDMQPIGNAAAFPAEPQTEPGKMTYETFYALSPEQKDEYLNSFESYGDFFLWLIAAQEEFRQEHPEIEIGPDGTIDLSKPLP